MYFICIFSFICIFIFYMYFCILYAFLVFICIFVFHIYFCTLYAFLYFICIFIFICILIFICIFSFYMYFHISYVFLYFICIFIFHISNHSLILIFTYHSDNSLLFGFSHTIVITFFCLVFTCHSYNALLFGFSHTLVITLFCLIFTYHSDSALLLEFYFHSCIFPEIYLTILSSQTPNTFCRHYCLVHRFQNNYTINLPANPTVQLEKPRRSPLRLRFYTCTLESASYAIGIVISETM